MFEPFNTVKSQRYFIHSQCKGKYNGKSKLKFHYFLKDQPTTYNLQFYFSPSGYSTDAIQINGKQSERYYQHHTEMKKEKWQ